MVHNPDEQTGFVWSGSS